MYCFLWNYERNALEIVTTSSPVKNMSHVHMSIYKILIYSSNKLASLLMQEHARHSSSRQQNICKGDGWMLEENTEAIFGYNK